jgi:hypothetical protein
VTAGPEYLHRVAQMCSLKKHYKRSRDEMTYSDYRLRRYRHLITEELIGPAITEVQNTGNMNFVRVSDAVVRFRLSLQATEPINPGGRIPRVAQV